MSGYIFRQSCRPRGDFRIREVAEFLDLLSDAFHYPVVYDSRSKPVNWTEDELRGIFEKAAARHLPGLGATLDFFTIPPRKRDPNTVAIQLHTGTQPGEPLIDTYNISVDRKSKLPDFTYFEKSILIFRPFEAYLAEDDNEYQMDASNREQAIPNFDKPAIIRGFHYLDKDLARSIGGIDYCLKAPAWHVERFCEGILIELVPGPFDSSNPEHVKTQEEVMDYFDLW